MYNRVGNELRNTVNVDILEIVYATISPKKQWKFFSKKFVKKIDFLDDLI